jgi:hypothetical protein
VWRRQVGLVWGTRWPAESSAGRMVARTTGRSRGQFLGWASKPRSSRDYVGAESWVAIGGGYTEFAGFAVVHQKITGLLGWATKLRPKTWRGGVVTQAGLTTQEGRFDHLAGLTAQGVSDRPSRCCREASKQRTRVGIARLASRLSRLRSLGIRSMEKIWRLPNSPLRGLYPLLLSNGSLVFWVPPYKHLRGWMAANSWNPSSFVFPFSFSFSSSFS